MIKEDIRLALDNIKFSSAPYSNFNVSAVLTAKNGEKFTGVNIESASFTPTICAERVAIFKAVSEGIKEFSRIVVVGGLEGVVKELTTPCGVCRQVMMDYCDPKTFEIVIAVDEDNYEVYTLEELLPKGFGPKDLEG
ncbi:cytidine deaminase [Helcococcus sueciensis]|uniref:cytidine deaminase n=1 Tax=Helcococcus sueciensis TaxID=241555 RepID=UPI000418EB3D|nr:cytidine deaminase [Helcococcus sueciensis]